MTSNWPIWRTRPAGFKPDDHRAVLLGSLAVLIGGPLLGGLVHLSTILVLPPILPAPESAKFLAATLMGSPLFSWLILIGAIPLSDLAARRGFAGWGIAGLAGLAIGLSISLLVTGIPSDIETPLVMSSLGYCLIGLLYWLAIRVFYPAIIGLELAEASS